MKHAKRSPKSKKIPISLKYRPFILSAFVLGTISIYVFTASSPSVSPANDQRPIADDQIVIAPLPAFASQPAPPISAQHAIILDRSSKTVLYQKLADVKVLPASTTKMLTALVVLDSLPLDKVITVTRSYPIGQNIGFKPGEQLTVEQLLFAMLVQSGNDAAEILAENSEGGRSTFITSMNSTARKLRLTGSHFVNPTGIDENGHYSTATDLVRLADVALRNPEFSRIVSTENAVVSNYIFNNVNQLLGKIPGVKGVKTGYTEGAGQALVTLVERDGHEVLMAVLGSTDRFADTERLIDWAYSNFRWQTLNPPTDN